MPRNVDVAETWRASHPEVLVFALARENAHLLSDFAPDGMYDSPRTRSIAAEIDADRDIPAPASAWNALSVPNGDYRVQSDNGITFWYRIYTVQEGTLAGKRIIKVKDPRTNIFKGFGFINCDGSFSLWRRYQRDDATPYVEKARQLIRQVGEANRECETCAFPAGLTISTQVSGGRLTNGNIEITINHRCALCNAQFEFFSTNSGIVLCDRHLENALAPRPDPELERLLAEEEEIERRQNTLRAALNANPVTPIPSNIITDANRGATVQLPMSELGDGQIL